MLKSAAKEVGSEKQICLKFAAKEVGSKKQVCLKSTAKEIGNEEMVCMQPSFEESHRYSRCRPLILQQRRSRYYRSVVHNRAARLLHHSLHRVRENFKNKVYRMQNKLKISSAKKAHYAIKEPKLDMKQMYVKSIKQRIAQKPSLRRKRLNAVKSARKPLAENIKASKLTYAVVSIASRRLLQRVLKVRKQSVGELLACIRAVNSLKISDDVFRHTASSKPFFYDQSYYPVKHTSPIVVDSLCRCVIAEEEGERDVKQAGLKSGNALLSVNFLPQWKQSVLKEESECG